MRLIEAPAKAGYVWFRQGIWVFRRNPVAFMMLIVAYLFAWLIISMVPIVGSMLPTLLAPGISVGFMAASRAAVGGKPVYPTLLVSGFRDHGKRVARDLLVLGVVNLVLVFAAFALSAIIDGGVVFRSAVLGIETSTTDITSRASDVSAAMALFMVAYMPISVVMWFSPVLVAWHDLPPAKAMFFSWIALWRNRWAFAVYAMCWFALELVIGFIGLQINELAGTMLLSLMMLAPLFVITIAMVYCSFFATYRGCFEVPPDAGTPRTDLPADQ